MISFEPFNKKTVSIPKTLINFSQEKNISIKSVDFTLEAYETLIRRKGIQEDIIVEDTENIDQEILLSEDARIYQRYEIKLFPAELDLSPYNIALSYNQNKTKVVATIKAGVIFSKDNNFEAKFKEYIWHKKLSSGFLVGIFEEKFQQQYKKLLEVLPYGKKLSKDLSFNVALGIDPIDAVDSQVEKIYLQEKVNERNYIDGVELGELVLRYKKHKEGVGGRSCTGKYIEPKKAVIITIPQTDETIKIQESDEYIEFYANDNGYVVYENDFLCISKTLKLEGANFKTTGDLDAGELNEEVSVAIEHSQGTQEDAIGNGLVIDVKDLNVDGSIGSNVKIAASDLNIDAQTHKNVTLEVKNRANIKLHRGDLITNEAEIEILETGKVRAHKSIHVKKMVGGEVIAPKVYVDELVSNGKIIASQLIEIKSISGSNNTFIIDPNKIEAYHKEKEQLTQKLEQARLDYQKDLELLETNIHEHGEELERIKTFQRRVLQAQNAGKTPMKQDILRIKDYKRKSDLYKQKREQLTLQQQELENLEVKLQKMLEQDLHAQIKTNSLYDGHSKVIFVDPKNAQEISTLPQGRASVISLSLDPSGKRVIRTLP